ncbi:hypothetical protein QBC42DRAFT_250753 [Cladorrhinum samala]|uniref:Uncharacterized protein n=1 Tax=Cladorrhinum samala TaxID=585594 RepID=A0AAV9HTR5_9PEZI|nr:hypothetical protein QBC42DRAFT_250753 [Cladorrhinum samala]
MVSPLALLSGSSRNGGAACDFDGNPVSRNKLRKPQHLRKPAQSHVENATANEIQAEMGNHVSFENVPRPRRKPRSAPRRLPSLPCVPIYETFAVAAHEEAALREEKLAAERADDPAASFRRCPPRSWPQSDRFFPRASKARDSEQTTPAYDRALSLAESYRSILPDYHRMIDGEEDEEKQSLRRQQSERNLRQPRRLYVPSLTLGSCQDRRHDDNRNDIRNQVLLPSARHDDEVPVTPPSPSPSRPPPPPVPPPKSRARSMTASSVASSLTAVDGSSIITTAAEDAAGFLIPRRHSETIPEEETPDDSPPVDARPSTAIDQTTLDEQSGVEERTTFEAQVGELPALSNDNTSSSSLALQICSELLTAELAKVLAEPDSESESGSSGEVQEGSRARLAAAKLQVLMMIEAYEGLMEHWRDVLSNCPSPSPSPSQATYCPGVGSSEDDSPEARCARDAVAILTHWLACLHAVYRDRFGDE